MNKMIIGRTYSGDDSGTGNNLSHHGIKGQKWGVRNGPPYPLHQTREYNAAKDISKQNFDKLNELYKSMPLKDRQFIDPDSTKKPQNYYPSFNKYKGLTAYNDISDNGFVIAEKIPKNQNVDGTHGVEIGIGVKTKNQGIGTSLTKGLVDWFNSQDEYDVMWWPVDKANKASIHIAEKNGFVKDPLGDHYIYATDDAYKKLSIDNVSHSSTLFGTRIYRGV